MRHCSNENVDVYESIGKALPPLLREAADKAEALEASWFNITTHSDLDNNYVVMLYAH